MPKRLFLRLFNISLSITSEKETFTIISLYAVQFRSALAILHVGKVLILFSFKIALAIFSGVLRHLHKVHKVITYNTCLSNTNWFYTSQYDVCIAILVQSWNTDVLLSFNSVSKGAHLISTGSSTRTFLHCLVKSYMADLTVGEEDTATWGLNISTGPRQMLRFALIAIHFSSPLSLFH